MKSPWAESTDGFGTFCGWNYEHFTGSDPTQCFTVPWQQSRHSKKIELRRTVTRTRWQISHYIGNDSHCSCSIMFHWHWKFFWFCTYHIPPCTKIESCVNDPVDLIFERYSQECLKEGTRNDRGSGSIFVFEGDHTPIANNMEQRFIKESKNKDKLNEYSAKKLISLHEGSQLMVARRKTQVCPLLMQNH